MTGPILPRARVPAAFDHAAPAYDRLVGLNPGYHTHLRRAAAAVADATDGTGEPARNPHRPAEGPRILDLGCGTGASTRALLDAVPGAHLVAVDASAGMLDIAARKSWPDTVRFAHRRAEDLPDDEVHGPFDAVFAAYLVRNLPDPDVTLTTLHALLRPGGVLVVHDYSLAEHPLPRLTWHVVCWTVIIPAARLVSGRARLHRYLWHSVREFDSPRRFERRLRRAGFTAVRCSTVDGWQRGIVHTFRAHRGQA